MSAIIGRYSNAVSQHKESDLSRPICPGRRRHSQTAWLAPPNVRPTVPVASWPTAGVGAAECHNGTSVCGAAG
jgi:hypothetical protein